MCVCVCVCVCVCMHTQLCPTIYGPVDYSLPGFSVHGIFQARILEWDIISFFQGSSQTRDQTHISCVSCIGRWILYHWVTRGNLYICIFKVNAWNWEVSQWVPLPSSPGLNGKHWQVTSAQLSIWVTFFLFFLFPRLESVIPVLFK